MSRFKHLLLIIFKVVFILLCFVGASIYSMLANADMGLFELMKAKKGLDSCEIMVLDSSFSDRGAALSYEVKDGKIIFDLTQKGDRYDDVCVLITYPAYSYDASLMREYLRETIGDKAEKEEDYLSAMEEGPWRCTLNYSLTGETEGVSPHDVVYTVLDYDDVSHTGNFTDADDVEVESIEDIPVYKGDKYSFMLIFGAEGKGALPSGQYVFSADLGLSGLYESNEKLSFGTTLAVITTVCVQSVRENGLDIFGVENWLVFYGIMVVMGLVIYSWRDLRASIKIFGAVTDSMGHGFYVIVQTYVNGTLASEEKVLRGGPSVFVALLITILCYMVFLLTIPIRIVIHLVRDIIYLFAEDYELEAFSFVGNILGSVGIYVAIFGFVALFAASYLIGAIALVVGVVMCIVAGKICRNREEDYA